MEESGDVPASSKEAHGRSRVEIPSRHHAGRRCRLPAYSQIDITVFTVESHMHAFITLRKYLTAV